LRNCSRSGGVSRLHALQLAFPDDRPPATARHCPRDHLGDRQTVAAIAAGDLGHEPQMAGDEPVRGVTVAGLGPTLSEHVFFPALQHREPPDLLKILGEAGFGRKDRGARIVVKLTTPASLSIAVV
jgi:hypothetical protein